MASSLISTRELSGVRVLGRGGSRRIGKIRSFVFHPQEKRCVGFVVKRPDVALMFRRRDLFVALDGCDVVDGRIVVRSDPAATDREACKRLGIDWDACVLWLGLPVMCRDGTAFGAVGSVTFDLATGRVEEIEADAGAAYSALLGKLVVPASLILGFRRGLGMRLAESRGGRASGSFGDASGRASEEGVEAGGSPPDPSQLGALVVADEVKDCAVEGGLAEKAGQATAVVRVKAKDAVEKAKDKARPSVDKAKQAAGDAVGKGAFALGRQIGRSKGMFSAFKEEYGKARREGESASKR